MADISGDLSNAATGCWEVATEAERYIVDLDQQLIWQTGPSDRIDVASSAAVAVAPDPADALRLLGVSKCALGHRALFEVEVKGRSRIALANRVISIERTEGMF